MRHGIIKGLLAGLLAGISAFSASADEGMWMINAIDAALEKKMQERGLELCAGEIYNADAPGACVADAVVSMEFGCTGSIISENGLIITNHHCAYGDVHALSTPEHNYLEEGFWAMTGKEERNIKDKKVYFLKRVLDITEEVEMMKKEADFAGKPLGMRKLSFILEKKYEQQTGMSSWLASMWGGSKYYMALYEVYADVRLVAAPPVSSAAFGGDVDNWEWPQHKCDFAMYRIYTAPDGSAAEYSETNVPMKSHARLKISLDGYSEGDYTMVIGYPGRTNRYSSSAETLFDTSVKLPVSNSIRAEQMEIIKRWMNEDPSIRLKYSDYYFTLSNMQENFCGLVECCGRFDVVWEKEAIENELQEWIMADPARMEKWGSLIEDLKTKYKAVSHPERNAVLYRETMIRGTRIGLIMRRAYNPRNQEATRRRMVRDYDEIDLRLEKDLMRFCLKTYIEDLDPQFFTSWQKEAMEKFSSDGICDAEAFVEALWKGSIFTSEAGIRGLLDGSITYEEIYADSLSRFLMDTKITDFNKVKEAAEGSARIIDIEREYTHALYQMRLDKGIVQYPDANSTMRITYGTVGSLEPRDGIMCDWKTTPAGIIEKFNPSVYDFSLNDRQQELYNAADWGRWGFGPEGKNMYVNFLTDNDITGGNSGSPVLNSKGELIGLAFDGNKESLASDVWYTPGYNKCVCVDIRFVLWTLDCYAGMTRIIEELGF